MAQATDPIKRLRLALGLRQGAFGESLGGIKQSSISEWEAGAPLSPVNAVIVWHRYGSRLRRMGCTFESLLLPRNGYGQERRRRA